MKGLKGSIQGGENTDSVVRSYSAQVMWGQNFAADRGHLELAAQYNQRPDPALLLEQKWYRGTYLVANPSFTAATASNSNPQFVLADHVGLANSTRGGIINLSAAGT